MRAVFLALVAAPLVDAVQARVLGDLEFILRLPLTVFGAVVGAGLLNLGLVGFFFFFVAIVVFDYGEAASGAEEALLLPLTDALGAKIVAAVEDDGVAHVVFADEAPLELRAGLSVVQNEGEAEEVLVDAGVLEEDLVAIFKLHLAALGDAVLVNEGAILRAIDDVEAVFSVAKDFAVQGADFRAGDNDIIVLAGANGEFIARDANGADWFRKSDERGHGRKFDCSGQRTIRMRSAMACQYLESDVVIYNEYLLEAKA